MVAPPCAELFAFEIKPGFPIHACVQFKPENPPCFPSHMQPGTEDLVGASRKPLSLWDCPELRAMLPGPGSDKPPPGSATAGDIPGDQEWMLRMCKVLAQPGSRLGVCQPDREVQSQTEPKKTGSSRDVLHQPGRSPSPASQCSGHQNVTQDSSLFQGPHESFQGFPSPSPGFV